MKRFIIWLKRILFRNKYKRNLINELKPGDLFWSYLYEYMPVRKYTINHDGTISWI